MTDNVSPVPSYASSNPGAAPDTLSRDRRRRRLTVILCLGAGLAVAFGIARQRWAHATAPPSNAQATHVEGKRIVLSDELARRIQLELAEVGQTQIVPAFSVVGTVTFDPAHVARVGARLRGIVRDVYRFEGSRVRAGEALATVDSPELGEAQASVAIQASEYRATQVQRTRQQSLAEHQLTTERSVEEAVAAADRSGAILAAAQHRVSALAGAATRIAGRGLGVHVLASPLSGTIIERHVSKGQLIDANHVAFLVADLDHIWVELSVFERALPSIRVGDVVELQSGEARLDAGADMVLGRVAQVGAIVDAASSGATVRVHVDNLERKFRPGQSVNATIRGTAVATSKVTTVPSSAVIYVDGKPSVFVAEGPRSVVVAAVELGETNGHAVHVNSGLHTGQHVVIRGAAELRNELFR